MLHGSVCKHGAAPRPTAEGATSILLKRERRAENEKVLAFPRQYPLHWNGIMGYY